jgi:GH24 family phage-related lysozyme (muramidase)
MDKIIGAYVTAVREWIMSPYGRINSYPQRIIDDLLRLGLLGALVAVPTATVFALPALIPAIVNSIKPLLPISPSIKPLEKPSQKPPQKPPVQPPQKPPEKPPVKPPVSVETGKPGAMKASDKLVSFIANYESFSATPYRGADSQNRTIGYGHVIKPGENYERLTEEQARELLKKDIEHFVDKVNALTKDISLTQQQFDALVDFAYNCGEGALARSTLLKDIKGGVATDEKLKADFEAWCKCNGKTLLGLWRRRIDEWEMWKSGDYARNYYKR